MTSVEALRRAVDEHGIGEVIRALAVVIRFDIRAPGADEIAAALAGIRRELPEPEPQEGGEMPF